MFIIAHRLSTVKNCDLIVALDKGNIIEAGTHEELISKKGYYYKYYSYDVLAGSAQVEFGYLAGLAGDRGIALSAFYAYLVQKQYRHAEYHHQYG